MQEPQTNESPIIENKRGLSNADASTKPIGSSEEDEANESGVNSGAATVAAVQGGYLEQSSEAVGVSEEKSLEEWQVTTASIHSMAFGEFFNGSIVRCVHLRHRGI